MNNIDITLEAVIAIYPLCSRIWGPYWRMGRANYTLLLGRKKHGITRARLMMEIHLQRRLNSFYEVVDHINNDQTDDRIENFQLLTAKQNQVKDRTQKFIKEFTCLNCGEAFTRTYNHSYRDLIIETCSRSCQARLQWKRGKHSD